MFERLPSLMFTVVSFGLISLVIMYLMKTGIITRIWSAFKASKSFQQVFKLFASEVLSNWRLVLLGITGIVLSVSSGWTTWDGMTNFTGSPILSFLITFGIQGVMLIAAWLIGETFAQSFVGGSSGRKGTTLIGALTVLGLLTALIVGFLLLNNFSNNDLNALVAVGQWATDHITEIGIGVAVVAVIWLASSVGHGEDLISPYLRGIRTILSNLPLWVMFLACMATSVFFSFDSLFSTIFPPEERGRAAELRVRNEVAGVLSDVGSRLRQRRDEATEALFQSDGWGAFNGDLGQLVNVALEAPAELRKLKLERVQANSAAEEADRVAISTAKAEMRRLEAERERLERDLSDAATTAGPARSEVERLEDEIRLKNEEILKAETAAAGELRGTRGTGQAGRGPRWRELQRIVGDLRLDLREIETRLGLARQRLSGTRDQETAARRRLSEISATLAQKEVTISAAQERLKVLNQSAQNDVSDDLDAAGGLRALDRERTVFRRRPTKETFDRLQSLCGSLQVTLQRLPNLREQISGVNCEAEAASEAGSRVFDFNAALDRYASECGRGERVVAGTVNELLRFGNACILDSGLSGGDTAQFREALNKVALNRDDKAHRFVVTVNAFSDGNRLAYLALAIAIAIDGLVFMSGLFGANAVRSPLADAPIRKNRTAAQLEQDFNSRLGRPGYDRYQNARLVLTAIAPSSADPEFSGEIDLSKHNATTVSKITEVATVGAEMNLVRPVLRIVEIQKKDKGSAGGVRTIEEERQYYLVRPEFTEYLSLVCDRQIQLYPELKERLDQQNVSLDDARDRAIRQREEAFEERLRSDRIDATVERLLPILQTASTPHELTTAESVLLAVEPNDDDVFPNIYDINSARSYYEKMARLVAETHFRFTPFEQKHGAPWTGEHGKHFADVVSTRLERMARHILNVGASERVVRFENVGMAAPGGSMMQGGRFYLKTEFHRALIDMRQMHLGTHQPEATSAAAAGNAMTMLIEHEAKRWVERARGDAISRSRVPDTPTGQLQSAGAADDPSQDQREIAAGDKPLLLGLEGGRSQSSRPSTAGRSDFEDRDAGSAAPGLLLTGIDADAGTIGRSHDHNPVGDADAQPQQSFGVAANDTDDPSGPPPRGPSVPWPRDGEEVPQAGLGLSASHSSERDPLDSLALRGINGEPVQSSSGRYQTIKDRLRQEFSNAMYIGPGEFEKMRDVADRRPQEGPQIRDFIRKVHDMNSDVAKRLTPILEKRRAALLEAHQKLRVQNDQRVVPLIDEAAAEFEEVLPFIAWPAIMEEIDRAVREIDQQRRVKSDNVASIDASFEAMSEGFGFEPYGDDDILQEALRQIDEFKQQPPLGSDRPVDLPHLVEALDQAKRILDNRPISAVPPHRARA